MVFPLKHPKPCAVFKKVYHEANIVICKNKDKNKVIMYSVKHVILNCCCLI